MSSFFRTIRKRFIFNNKFSRYLFYAFGEILLIVIGVGIALSANNYAENKKAINQSRLNLENILEDLASDTLQLNKMLGELEKQLKIEAWLIEKQKPEKKDLDSIKMFINPINWTFNINDRSFQNIQNTNNKLVGYDTLYSDISKYYIITKSRISENNQLENLKNNKFDDFKDIIFENLYINTRAYQNYLGFMAKVKFNEKKEPDENIKLVLNELNSIKARNFITDRHARHNYLFINLTFCNIEAKAISKKIQLALSESP
jgi:hypothetical protein